MDRNQQQFTQEWRAQIEQELGRVRQLVQEAEAGCKQLIAQNPDDPMPVQNALNAIHVQVQETRSRMGTAWSDLMVAKLMASLDNRHVVAQGEHWLEEADQWIDEHWTRFKAYWLNESARAMWPRVSSIVGRPVPCVRCGTPLATSGTKSETVSCRSCNTVNQLTLDPVVAMYLGVAPDRAAEHATIEKRIAIDRWRRQVRLYVKRNHESISRVLGGDAEESVASLDQWEAAERDYWQAYADALARVKPMNDEEKARFVDGKMKHFARNHLHSSPLWRRQKGVAEPRPASPQELLAPIDGVSVELYAQLATRQGSLSPGDFQALLAQHRLDQAAFDRAAQGWQERMRDDTTFTVMNAYSQAFTAPAAPAATTTPGGYGAPAGYGAAPAGYGAAPPGYGAAPAQGGYGAAPAPAQAMTFELYCEILGAQNAWTRQGKDVNAMLKQVFHLTAMEFATQSAPWSTRMMTDPSLAMRMMPLMQQGEQKHAR